MSRYIDADEFVEKIIERAKDLRQLNTKTIGEALDDCKTINPEDFRPKGKWIAKEIMVRSPLARNYYCSQCKYEPLETINFCPNCGANNRGE